MCVYVCVWAGRLAKHRHGSTEQRADRRAGREALAWPRRPSLRGLEGGFRWQRGCKEGAGGEAG